MTAQTSTQPVTISQGSSGRNIGAEVRELVTVVAKVARHLGELAAADVLTTHATTADTTATIVVAGEAKQGKSSLINALVGADNLSPVDVDIATSAPVRIGYGPEERAILNLRTGKRLVVRPAELPEWVSMSGAELDQLRQVSSVEVSIPSPLLEPGVVLIDTPGVGGLVAGHAAMTLRSLESATAMLFVTDADTKLTGPELEFLARAGERLAAVVFVLTKIDATPSWRDVLAEDREVLARYAPRYADAPVVAVSARLANRARALAATDRPLSANLWAESGLGQLQGWISRRIGPVATTLAVANTVALACSTLERLGATAQRNVDAARPDPAITAAFEAEQRRVAQLRSDQMTWGGALERELFQARNALRDQIKSSAEGLRTSAAELIKTAKGHDRKQIYARIDSDLDAQAEDLTAAVNDMASAVCARMLAELNIASSLELSMTGSGVVNLKQFEPAATGAMTMLTGGMAAATGWGVLARVAGQASVTKALTGIGVSATTVGIALPLLGAVGVGYAIHHIRAGATRRTELQAWARREIDSAANERYTDVERVLTNAKLDITDVIRAGLLQRERDVSGALEHARAARNRSEQERVAQERVDRKVLATTNKLTETADELLVALLRAASLSAPNTAGLARPGATR